MYLSLINIYIYMYLYIYIDIYAHRIDGCIGGSKSKREKTREIQRGETAREPTPLSMTNSPCLSLSFSHLSYLLLFFSSSLFPFSISLSLYIYSHPTAQVPTFWPLLGRFFRMSIGQIFPGNLCLHLLFCFHTKEKGWIGLTSR